MTAPMSPSRASLLMILASSGVALAGPQPKMTYGPATIEGSIPRAKVEKVLKAVHGKLRACFASSRDRALIERGQLRFEVAADGAVENATLGVSAEVDACVLGVVAKLSFPRATEGRPSTVVYPIEAVQAYSFGVLSSGGTPSALGEPMGGELKELPQSFGFGRKGGDPGMGTIGTMQGIGSATGSGFGVSGLRLNRVRAGAVTTKGTLDKNVIRRVVRRYLAKITYCYEKQLLATPDLKGTVTAEFVIGVDGKVRSSTATGLGNTDVESCIARAIQQIEFPKPKGGEVNVRYPFVLAPST